MVQTFIDEEIYKNPGSWNMTNDLIFKAIFGRETDISKTLLMDLVNAVLGLEGEARITAVSHLNPYNYQLYMSDKLTMLDIKARTGDGRCLNIEIQVGRGKNHFERALYYWSELFSGQVDEGIDYEGLDKTIGIHFIDHVLDGALLHAHSVFRLHDIDRHVQVSDLLELHFVQLPRIQDLILSGEVALADWISLMKGINVPEKKEAIRLLTDQKEMMLLAAREYSKVTAEDMFRAQLGSQQKFRREMSSDMNYAREEGRRESLLEVVERMVENQLPQETILSVTGLSKDEFELLK